MGTRASTKVFSFAWCVAKDEILSIDNLIRRRVVMVNQCCMCLRDGRVLGAFVYYCPVAKELCNVLVLWGMSWTCGCGMGLDFRGGRTMLKVWIMIPLCLMWLIWREE